MHDDDGQAGAQSMVTDGHREPVAVGEPCAEPVQKSERTTVPRREGVPSCSTDDGAYVFRLHVCSDVEDEGESGGCGDVGHVQFLSRFQAQLCHTNVIHWITSMEKCSVCGCQ